MQKDIDYIYAMQKAQDELKAATDAAANIKLVNPKYQGDYYSIYEKLLKVGDEEGAENYYKKYKLAKYVNDRIEASMKKVGDIAQAYANSFNEEGPEIDDKCFGAYFSTGAVGGKFLICGVDAKNADLIKRNFIETCSSHASSINIEFLRKDYNLVKKYSESCENNDTKLRIAEGYVATKIADKLVCLAGAIKRESIGLTRDNLEAAVKICESGNSDELAKKFYVLPKLKNVISAFRPELEVNIFIEKISSEMQICVNKFFMQTKLPVKLFVMADELKTNSMGDGTSLDQSQYIDLSNIFMGKEDERSRTL